jgi:hypothetical protein
MQENSQNPLNTISLHGNKTRTQQPKQEQKILKQLEVEQSVGHRRNKRGNQKVPGI